MATSSLLETLASYVPMLITRHLAHDPTPISESRSERFPAAVLFADISGFTALTERLAQRGPVGAEELTRFLNAYFGQLIELIVAHGGDVVKFAGDALLALWPTPGTDEDLATVTRRAALCSLAVQERLKEFRPAEDVRLSLRVALGAGDISTMHLGGVFGRWDFLVAGDPLIQVGVAGHDAEPGEVVLTPAAWALVRDACEGQPLEAGSVRLDSVRAPLPLRPQATFALSPEFEAGLRAYIPGAILSRLAAREVAWLAELRYVTVIFVNLPGLNHATPVEEGQTVMRALQAALNRYEGSLNKLSVDDKGASLVTAMGLPPLAHEDDAARGVRAAMEMQAELQKLGWRSAIGVTTGRAFCGSVGNARRREYTMIGDVVNLSARLMQAAPGDILCDEATFQASRLRVDFQELPAIKVKGKVEPIAIYRPLGRARAAFYPPSSQTTLIGRRAERALLAGQLQALLRGGTGGAVVLEGDAGIGKSRLVADLLQQSDTLGIKALYGAADAIEKSTPYFAWRRVFAQLFTENGRAVVQVDADALHANVLSQLRGIDEPELANLAPLLNAVLPLDLLDNETTVQMTGEARAEATRGLLLRLLQRVASQSPRLIVLEDGHWLDSASWALALAVTEQIQSVLLVLAIRPMRDPIPTEYERLIESRTVEQIQLDTLSAGDSVALACQSLGVTELPQPVADLILDKAQGNPFFSEELAYALRDTGLILVDDGKCAIAPGTGDFSELNLPDTVHGVVTSRIDRLTAQQQLTVKTASVIGRTFGFILLRNVYPVEVDRAHLGFYLETLKDLDITPLEAPEPHLTYIFRHIITQEVAYDLMLFAQRKQLHQAVAEWYELAHADDLSSFYPLLAYHWSKAEVASKAVDYLLQAGDQARGLYALQEAIEYYQRAMVYLRKQEAYERAARTLMKLGLTYHLAFDFQQSREAYEEGFALWQRAGESEPSLQLEPAPHPLRVDWIDPATVLDPTIAGDPASTGVIDQLFSGLVELSPEMDVVPNVAQSWEVLEEGRRYIFHLREDECWSDGTPLTAGDFEYAWKRVLNPATKSQVASLLYDVKGARAFHRGESSDPDSVGVRAVDDRTLLVELEGPTSYFPHLLTYNASYPVPRRAVEAHGERWTEVDNIVTNGPFRLEAWESSTSLSLVRSPTYRRRTAGNVQRVELLSLADSTARLERYEAGGWDALELRGLSYDARDYARQRHAGDYVSVPGLETAYVGFIVDRPPFDDAQVRRAFVLATDRETLAGVVTRGFWAPATGGFVPPGMPGHSAGIGLPYDPDRACEILEEAGYSCGQGFPAVEFLGGLGTDPLGTHMQEGWQEKLGVEVKWQTADWATFLDKLEEDPPHMFLLSWDADYPDPDNYLRGCPVRRWARWQHETYADLVERARRVTDQKERMRLYGQADGILVEETAVMPLLYGRRHLLVKPWAGRFPTSASKWWYWKDVVIEAHDD